MTGRASLFCYNQRFVDRLIVVCVGGGVGMVRGSNKSAHFVQVRYLKFERKAYFWFELKKDHKSANRSQIFNSESRLVLFFAFNVAEKQCERKFGNGNIIDILNFLK